MSSGAVVLGLWSIILEPGKTLSQNVAPGIQITNISFGEEVTGSDRCVVKMKYPEFENDSDDEEDEDDEDSEGEGPVLPKLITKEAVIAILRPNVTEQVSVNITLVDDVEIVEFSVTGPNAVHIVGHYCRQEDFDQEPYSDSDGEYDSDDEEIDSDLEDYSMEEGMSGMLGEDDDEEDSEAERFVEVKETATKKRAAAADADESMDATADESMSSALSKNQKKKLAKKMKSTDGSAVEVAAAPVAAVKKAVVAAPVAAAKKEEPKVEKKVAGKAAPVTLAGGLVILDSKKGEGAVAKSGKKVSMRYIGKLDNGKIFDSNTKGSPLSFTLGRGEVIKGWDNGIIGMAVGGERKLTIPAALAYGKKGTQGIPGGATLNFDVKLISIK